MSFPAKPRRNADGSKTAPTAIRDTLQALALRLFPDFDIPGIFADLGHTTHPRNYRPRRVPASPARLQRWIENEMLRRALRENPRDPYDVRAKFAEALVTLRRAKHAAYTRDQRKLQQKARMLARELAAPVDSLYRAELEERRMKAESAERLADLNGWFDSVVTSAHLDEGRDA